MDDEGDKERNEIVGFWLAVAGSTISCVGVVANNIVLDHVLAMQIWMFSNLMLLVWAYGLSEFSIPGRYGEPIYQKRQYFSCGLSGVVLCWMYAFYSVTNLWGLLHV